MPLKGACVTDGFWSLSYGIFAMHFSMGPQGSLPYVLVALAGDGHYVQFAQHVHHAMDHISE